MLRMLVLKFRSSALSIRSMWALPPASWCGNLPDNWALQNSWGEEEQNCFIFGRIGLVRRVGELKKIPSPFWFRINSFCLFLVNWVFQYSKLIVSRNKLVFFSNKPIRHFPYCVGGYNKEVSRQPYCVFKYPYSICGGSYILHPYYPYSVCQNKAKNENFSIKLSVQ